MKLFNTPYTATFTRDKRGVILLTYVAWRVEKPLLFLQAAGGRRLPRRSLTAWSPPPRTSISAATIWRHSFPPQPGAIKASEIEQAILDDMRGPMLDKFGVRVDQVGFKRIAFPEENVPAVLANMRSERKAEADRLRAEGDREAQGIRDDALVKSEETLREGREKAGRMRGQAEKDAAEIYASAHKLDPEFYRFWRSLEATKKVLGGKATLILRTDQGFFDVLMGPGQPAPKPPPSTKDLRPTSVTPRGPAMTRKRPYRPGSLRLGPALCSAGWPCCCSSSISAPTSPWCIRARWPWCCAWASSKGPAGKSRSSSPACCWHCPFPSTASFACR